MLAQMLQTPPHFISTTIFLITHIRAFGTEKWVYSKQPWQELARLQKHYPKPRPLFNEYRNHSLPCIGCRASLEMFGQARSHGGAQNLC